MKLDLVRLSQYQHNLEFGFTHDELPALSDKALAIIEECVRAYIYEHDNNNRIINVLTDYGILVEEESDTETPFVKPHNFTTNG